MNELEIEALNNTKFSRTTPFIVRGVMNTQLSIARHYGGCTMQGAHYTYFPESDELIRDDVLKWLVKYRKTKKQSPIIESAELF